MAEIAVATADDAMQAFLGRLTWLTEAGWRRREHEQWEALARIGAGFLEALVHFQKGAEAVTAFICMDEEQMAAVVRATDLTAAELLAPYIAALQTIEGCSFVAMGFEMSRPADKGDTSLYAAGLSICFVRSASGSWERKEIMPMVGHPI